MSFGMIEGPAGNEGFLKTRQAVLEVVGENVFGHLSPVQSEVGVKQKRVLRTIKKFEKLVMMTIGEDVGFDTIVLTNALTLVGQLEDANVILMV